jgi:hypothetical protein
MARCSGQRNHLDPRVRPDFDELSHEQYHGWLIVLRSKLVPDVFPKHRVIASQPNRIPPSYSHAALLYLMAKPILPCVYVGDTEAIDKKRHVYPCTDRIAAPRV